MNILVTGGAGFIASHIVDKLIDDNHKVVIVDNLSTGNTSYINPYATFYKCDILDASLEEIFKEQQPDVVIHHAAQIDVQTSIQNPTMDAQINILGTIGLLQHCKTYKVRKIIYSSSAAVYGTPQYLSIDELHPIEPISFYGISKLTPEQYIKVFSELYGLDFTIFRYSNVYGPRQDPKGEGGVISIFLDKLMKGKSPVIYGDGEQTRDFIYVKDIVAANIAALTQGSRSLMNISRNERITVNKLLRIMCEVCSFPFAPNYAPVRNGDILHSQLNNRLACQLLDWEPSYSLRDGLIETYQYYAAKDQTN